MSYASNGGPPFVCNLKVKSRCVKATIVVALHFANG